MKREHDTKNSELLDQAERKLEAFCRKAKEVFHGAKLARASVDRCIDEMIDELVMKYQEEEESPTERARLLARAEEARAHFKKAKAKYLRF
jgi:hypothetical protein